jgi:hypothetical protein
VRKYAANGSSDRADIEQEVNGLYTPDRKEKLDASKVKAIFDQAEKVYFDHLAKKA